MGRKETQVELVFTTPEASFPLHCVLVVLDFRTCFHMSVSSVPVTPRKQTVKQKDDSYICIERH